MLAASASLLNVPVSILDVGDNAPAKQILSPSSDLPHVDGAFSDPIKIKELAARVDVLTVEIEHVDVTVLEEITSSSKVEVHPSPSTIRIIQDKFVQKKHLSIHGIAVADYLPVASTEEDVELVSRRLGLPLMLKSRTMAYDGRGNYVLSDLSKTKEAIVALGNRPLYAEKMIELEKEVAVMVVRTTSGEIRSYPVVETVHKDNVCHLVFAPLRVTDRGICTRARKLAEETVSTFTGAGVFGVEMFLSKSGAVIQITKMHLARLISS